MTVTYTSEVATSSFSCFLKLLARWRGSIYKLLWKDFAAFAALYFLLGFLYRFAFNEDQRKIFELIARYCASNNSLIPVAFVLGFYVTLIMTRYWSVLGHIPWPDHMAMFVTANVQGVDDRSRMMRRTMLRYLCLSYTMTMMAISPAVKKRFPTQDHLIEAGLLTANEAKSLDSIKTPHNKFFIPLAWTTRLVCKARKERRIEDEFALKTLIDEINTFRMHLATLFVYDWITVPLVYTQVVTIAVYMFFLACLMGRQFLSDDPDVPDMYFPLFTFLEYFFYMGWLKVAECLVNPFGEDEDDFDVNFLVDRNLQVAYIIADEVHNELPDLIRDQHWNDTHFEMPYTAEAEQYRKAPHLGSAVDIRSLKDQEFGLTERGEMSTIQEADSEEIDGEEEPKSPRSFFHSPISVGGSVLRRLISRQESRSVGRSSIKIPISRPRDSRIGSSNDSESPRESHQLADDLQFAMEDDNPDVHSSENVNLIKKPEPKSSSESIPMQPIKPLFQRHSRDLGQPSTTGTSPQNSSNFGLVSPPPPQQLTNLQQNQPLTPVVSTSTNQNITGDGLAAKDGVLEPSELQTDVEKERTDLATSLPAQSQIPPAYESMSSTIRDSIISSVSSPDPFSSVWVLASSQLNLATNEEIDQGSRKQF